MAHMHAIIEGVIVLILGLALTPVVRSGVSGALNGSSATETAVLNLVTLVYIFVIVALVVAMLKFNKK